MINHQDVLASGWRLVGEGQVAHLRSSSELGRPLFGEGGAIDLLVFLCPSRSIGPAGRTFIVDYFAAWLVKDAIATVAHLEAEIGIFVVSGRVARIEFANALEQRFGNHQCRG